MYVLDASALYAFLRDETGAEIVAHAIKLGAVISTVNLSEIVAKQTLAGEATDSIHEALENMSIGIIPFDEEQAYLSGVLVRETKQAGLSFGDRACLALAKQRKEIALTADHIWTQVQIDVQIELIRTSETQNQ